MKPRIMLVDPSAEEREPLRVLLERHHCEVIAASSAGEALAKSAVAHMAILELRLEDGGESDFSGEETAAQLREQDIPCMFYSKWLRDHADVRRLLSSGGGQPLAMDAISKGEGAQTALNVAKPIMSRLRLDCPAIVHLSDLHFEPSDVEAPYDQERSRRELVSDLVNFNLHRRVIALAVTGDISRMCLDRSFDSAAEFLLELAKQLKLPKEHIILTPGNHDVNRYKALDALRNLDYRKRTGVSGSTRGPVLFKKFEDYLKFTEAFYGEAAFPPDRLWRVFPFPDSNLVIVALNSCVREGHPRYRCEKCETEHYHGWLGSEQIKGAIRELDQKYDEKTLRIAAFHHHALPREPRHGVGDCPADCLWDYSYHSDEAKNRLTDGGFQILLHGHQHKMRLSIDLAEPIRHIFGSGTLLIRDRDASAVSPWDNKYLVLDLSPRPDESQVLMRRYDPMAGRGKWVQDGELDKYPLSDVVLHYG